MVLEVPYNLDEELGWILMLYNLFLPSLIHLEGFLLQYLKTRNHITENVIQHWQPPNHEPCLLFITFVKINVPWTFRLILIFG